MNLLLLLGLLAGDPVLWDQVPLPRSPATVVATTPILTADFAGSSALAGMTIPARGVDVVTDGENPCLRLSSETRDGVSVWIPLPEEARQHYLVVKGRARAEGASPQLEFGAVAGTRTVTAAPTWARWSVAVAGDWTPFEAVHRLPLGADNLVVRLLGPASAWLDDLELSWQTRVRDQQVAALAEREGNLIVNGGFEGGEAGFRVITLHPTIARGEPPIPALLRVTTSEPNEGEQCAQIFVVDGPTILTTQPVVLQPGTRYTLSFDARARTTSVARMGVAMQRADGLETATREVALTSHWRRVKSTFETDQIGPAVWLPRIEGYPIESPYALELDGICLSEGDSGEYHPPAAALLSLDDGLSQPFGMGQILAPGETWTVKARLSAGEYPVEGELRGELLGALGAERVALTPRQVAVDAGASLETELSAGTLTPGWYRLRAWLETGTGPRAEVTRTVACLPPPDAEDGWRLAVRWTTPDGLFRGRARRTLLSRLAPYGLDDRWLGPNAVALWSTLAPQPGQIQAAALAAMIDDGGAAGLRTVAELDAWPTAAAAPDWLLARSPRGPDGRLTIPLDVWQTLVGGVASQIQPGQTAWALAAPPEGVDPEPARAALRAALAAADPAAVVLGPGEYHSLAATEVGPLDPETLEVAESVIETDPWAAEAGRVAELLEAASTGARWFLWPNQGLFPSLSGAPRTPGLTDPDGGPLPLVAAWSTLRQVVGERRPTTQAAGGDLRAVAFGDDDAVVAVWSRGAATELSLAGLPPAARLATGEALTLPTAEGRTKLAVGRWPLWLTDLSAEGRAAVLAAVDAAATGE